MTTINCSLIRGGTSRAAFFLKSDLPDDESSRNELLAQVMGGPDALQIDGIGGGHPLSSKVAVLSQQTKPEVDVSYLFLQVDPHTQTVSDSQNCGNILAGVGVYAIEKGWVDVSDPITTVRVHMENTDAICHLELSTPGGVLKSEGDTVIDGVPGSAAPIVCNFLDIAGSSCGALLPTGSPVDVIEGVRLTCIDNGMPVVMMLAEDLGVSGTEVPEDLDQNQPLKEKLETIRLAIGPKMNLGDVSDKTVPKMCLLSPSTSGGVVATRTFIPHVCHKSIGVLGAVSVATGCLVKGGIADEVVESSEGNPRVMDIEHPSGSFRVQLGLNDEGEVLQAGVIRTARLLFNGEVYL